MTNSLHHVLAHELAAVRHRVAGSARIRWQHKPSKR
jgi:hypothetical protein